MLQIAPRQTHPAMRMLLYVAAGLVFITGVQLFILTEQTEQFFAWTIQPPLTAATLGAAYWASCALELAAARERYWTKARFGIPAVLAFTALMLVVTLVHIDRFHLASELLTARIAAWAWLVVYAAVPVLLAGLWIIQSNQPGTELGRTRPLANWLRTLLIVQALVLLLLGLLMLFMPNTAIEFWPWKLTPLTARALGAWGVGLGVAVVHTLLENDIGRVRLAAIAYLSFGLLELVAVARYAALLDWARPGVVLYVIFLGSIVLAGIGGWLASRRGNRPATGQV